MSTDAKVSEILRQFVDRNRDKDITIRLMTGFFGERAFGFLLLVFAMVNFFPIPIPGVHAITSIPLIYLTVQQMIGRHEIWFPKRVQDYKLPKSVFGQIAKHGVPVIEKVEKISRPRLEFLTRGGFFCFFGAVGLLITLFLSIPLPMINFVPSIAIGCMALGFLNRDGVPLLIGVLIGFLWIGMWLYVGVSGVEFILTHLKETIHSKL